MPKTFTPKVVTANALIEGDVVYLAADGHWTRHLREAELLTDEAVAEERLLSAAAQTTVVVGAYLADMRAGADGPEPVHFREVFRSSGPSNRFHGKQADHA
ncbi:MAG: DUF2849 domain-containing protein [Roseovarius sp.]